MKAAPFTYHAPDSVAAAIALLGAHENARLLAGGQSLMPMLNLRVAAPDHLIDLRRIASLRGVEECGDTLRIGAMTTQRRVEHSQLVAQFCPLLAEATALVGHQQTRNRGTIGGSLCHLDPGAELPVVACALGAQMNVTGADGDRRVAFHDFAEGYLTTQLAADDILTSIDWPKAPGRTGVAFREFNRRPADFAIVSVAVQISLGADGSIARAWLALGGIQPTPLRLAAAEAALEGASPAALYAHWGRDMVADITCDGDALYPPDYRHHLCGTLLHRAVLAACAKAQGASHV